jgi:hypothetical protein
MAKPTFGAAQVPATIRVINVSIFPKKSHWKIAKKKCAIPKTVASVMAVVRRTRCQRVTKMRRKNIHSDSLSVIIVNM